MAVPQDDLGIGPDVDEQLHRRHGGGGLPTEWQRPCRHRRDRRCTAGRTHGPRDAVASSSSEAGTVKDSIGRQGKGGFPQRSDIQAEQQVMHDRIADDGHLEDVAAGHPGLLGELVDQFVERPAHGAGERPGPLRLHHHVRNPAHQVLAESNLRVHHPGRGEDLPGGEIAEMPGNRGRADIDGHPEAAFVEAWPGGHHRPLVPDRNSHLPVAGTERVLEFAEGAWLDRDAGQLPLLGEGGEETLGVPGRLVQSRGGGLDVAKHEHRIENQSVQLDSFADHLPVELALRRDVDHEIPADFGHTTETPVVHQSLSLCVARLGLGSRRQMSWRELISCLAKSP